MNDIDEALNIEESFWKFLKSHYTQSEIKDLSVDAVDRKRYIYTAGAEYGTKQARIKTLEKIRTKIFNESLDLKTLNYIDTELEKLRSE